MRKPWLTIAALLLIGGPAAADQPSEPGWANVEALATAARMIENFAYPPIDLPAAIDRVHTAALSIPGVDPARLKACTGRRQTKDLAAAAAVTAACADLGKRKGSDRYNAFKILVDAVAAGSDPQSGALLAGQLSSGLGGSDYAPANSPPDETPSRPAAIGLSLTNDPAGKRIERIEPNSPLREAAVEIGDLITAIDGTPAAPLSLEQAAKAMRGETGSPITLELARGGSPPRSVTVRRRPKGELATALFVRRYGDVPLIEIRELAAHVSQQLRDAWAGQSKDAKGLIIDLRGNPGGLLDESVSLADALLPAAAIGMQKARRPIDDQHFQSDAEQLAKGVPIIVLTDGKTAAGAEILAAALRDNHGALLLGSRTFGRGMVQTLFEIKAELMVRVTTSEFLRPNGAPIEARGVTPDCTVDPRRPDLIALAIRLAREGLVACPAP